ncbi:MAG: phosphoglucosamine mutase [Actinomycetia bacterium]|nr:phosphoglucosamine mutase [Actinomycetes bacterium]MCP4963196.1 phosphoglucosamine mutase [Actinomycetes bacterium]
MRFGTDGLRGPANAELTPELALRLGRAAARVMGLPKWYIGRDPRRSGPMLDGAVAAGLAAEGADVFDVGVMPTPGVAYLASIHDAGAVIVSASHNPWHDNGLKIFGRGGHKLDDATQAAIEATLDGLASVDPSGDPHNVGWVHRDLDARVEYVTMLVDTLDGRTLDGLRIVLDCGHGAASPVAGDAFRLAGASVEVMHAEPDGQNINDGVGSTDPRALARRVVESGASLGLAFDGDADRLIAVDASGNTVDGDRLLCLFAIDLDRRQQLCDRTLVVTVMSNLGLHRAMQERGINVEVTPVGDRYVLEALAAGNWSLGGEQSGHLVFTSHATTGDGILAGLLLSDLVARSNGDLGRMASEVMETVPQLLVNVATRVRPEDPAADLEGEIEAASRELGSGGRVLVRSSGTEPLVRVMVESTSAELARAIADRLEEAVCARYGMADTV